MPGSSLQEISDIDPEGSSRKRTAWTENDQGRQAKRPKNVVEKVQSSRQPLVVAIRRAVPKDPEQNLEHKRKNNDIKHTGSASRCMTSGNLEQRKSRKTLTIPEREDAISDINESKRDSQDELCMSDISSDVGFQTPQNADVPWQDVARNGRSRSRLTKSQESGGLVKDWTSHRSNHEGSEENSSKANRTDQLISDAAIHDTSVLAKRLSDNPNTASQTVVAGPEMTQTGGREKETMLKDKNPVFQNKRFGRSPNIVSTEALESAELTQAILVDSDDEFADPDLERTFLSLPSGTLETSQTSPQRAQPGLDNTPKLQWLPPKIYTPAKTASQLSPCRAAATPTSKPLPTTQSPEAHKPFIRGAFPEIAADRSPIPGLQNTRVLRTCFRIGEAIKASASAQRSQLDAVIELYARVLTSHRDPGPNSCRQYFELCDLFTEKPPYLHGTYTLWKGAPLWDQKSQVFLHEEGRGKMCRVVGRIKEVEPGTVSPKRDMVILSISETTWNEVKWVRGIVGA